MIAALELSGLLGDGVYLVLTVAFFGMALSLVRACAAIVGPDTGQGRSTNAATSSPASAPETGATQGRQVVS